jgi:hypothetical protein
MLLTAVNLDDGTLVHLTSFVEMNSAEIWRLFIDEMQIM